jgi:predicted glycosyl hydrolase (DUF1957 family)
VKYVNFLFHIYQPPVQTEKILAQIVQQSYEPLTRKICEYSDLKFTLNVNFSLVELLNESFPDVIANIKTAHEFGSLELTATGAYHPIFPLVPPAEVEKQLDINLRGNQRLLTAAFRPKGVFPPELALTCGLVPLFKTLGYQWTIADDGNLRSYGSDVPYNKIYSVDDFAVFFRSNTWANRFAQYSGQWAHGSDFVSELLGSMNAWMGNDEGYVIIALDGETFGHHHPELDERFLGEVFEALRKAQSRIRTAHLSDLYQCFPLESGFVPPGTWSTDQPDTQNRDYFSWWKSNRNRIHQLQWQFTRLVLEAVRNLEGNTELNERMDKALYSCQFWWASYWKFNPPEIYKGAFNMMRLLQEAADGRTDELLERGEVVFRQLITEIERKKHHQEA